MAIIKNYRLRLDAGNITPLIIHVNQYDRNEIWNFTLIDYQGNKYNTTEAAIVGKKPDGCLIVNNCTVSEGIVSVEVTEQMTAAAGKAVFELLIDGQVHGTANFIVMIERSPKDGAIESESDLSLFQRAIDATSTPAIIAGVQTWMDENLTPTTPVVDSSLSITGAAADAKKTGDEINDLKSEISSLSSIPTAVKNALDTLFQNVAFKNDDLYTDELAVIHNWATAVNLVSISAVFDSGTDAIYTDDTLEDLKQYLTVTASYDDETTAEVTTYTLSGELNEGQNTITVTYEGKTASFTVTAEERPPLYTRTEPFIIGSGNNRYDRVVSNYHYVDTSTNRGIYPLFDLLVDGGKSYRVVVDSSEANAQFALQAFNQNILTAVNNNQTFSSNDLYLGISWQSNLDSVCELPATFNNSPIVGFRIAFRKDSSDSKITSKFINKVEIYEV